MSDIAQLSGSTFVEWLDAREDAKREQNLGVGGSTIRLQIANDHLNRMISGERDE